MSTILYTYSPCTHCGKNPRIGLRYVVSVARPDLQEFIREPHDACSAVCIEQEAIALLPLIEKLPQTSTLGQCPNCAAPVHFGHGFGAAILGAAGDITSFTSANTILDNMLCSPVCVYEWALTHMDDDTLYFDEEDEDDDWDDDWDEDDDDWDEDDDED